MIIFQNIFNMNQEQLKLQTEEMWDKAHNKLYPDEQKMIEIPKNCTGFVILTEHDQPEVIEIKERTKMQGAYNTTMALSKGINFSCLCNLKNMSPTTRVFLLNQHKQFKVVDNDHFKQILIVRQKKGGSRISSDIADPAWATLGDHHHTLQMIGNNIAWPYDSIPSCIQNHCWRTIV
jgi:hypothetical protein